MERLAFGDRALALRTEPCRLGHSASIASNSIPAVKPQAPTANFRCWGQAAVELGGNSKAFDRRS
jgi:hypothetical protein